MNYPDFAFYPSTQLLLFFINCFFTSLNYYYGANIILKIYQKDCELKYKILYSIIAAIFFNVLITYAASFLEGLIYKTETWPTGFLTTITKIITPFSYFILYYIGIKLLSLTSYKSMKITKLSYIYYVCCASILRILREMFFNYGNDPRGFNYLNDIFLILTGAIATYIVYKLSSKFIEKNMLKINFTDNIIVDNIKTEHIKNFISCFFVYIFILIGYLTDRNFDYYILIFIILVEYLYMIINLDYIEIYKRNMDNKEEYILALNQSIEEFRGIKHDFNNILQTYSGYLVIENYERLKSYHEKVVSTTISAGEKLDISCRMAENPSFFSLLINKLQLCEKKDIKTSVSLMSDFHDVYMNELDFNRVIAILLDNAIEACEDAESRHINFAVQTKVDESKLIILSNDTKEDVNIEKIFENGFTTKSNHLGHGLKQVRSIIHQYGNVTFNVTFYKNIFTVYLELKPIENI